MTPKKETVYYALFIFNDWHLYLACTESGLCYVGSPNASFSELEHWVIKHIPDYEIIESKDKLHPYMDELMEYLSGERQEFTMNLDLRGTDFQKKVWDELIKVSYGNSATYTELAERMNRPDAPRAVGAAIGANPVLIAVPCHRMFGKHGEWRGYRGGLNMKKKLLDIEDFK